MPITKYIRKPFKYTNRNAVLYIAGLNVLVFLASLMRSEISFYLALNPVFVVKFHMYWQFFTYMFVHGDLTHLLCNMLSLIIFGMVVEKSMGTREFLLFYFLTGVLSGFFSFIFYRATGQNGVFLMGASGAIYALLFAYAVLFPSARIFIWGVLPVPAPILIAVYAVIELYSGVFGRGGNTAHLTHLAGLGFAWLYFVARVGVNPWKRWFSR